VCFKHTENSQLPPKDFSVPVALQKENTIFATPLE
jgi:hypothetical protein